MNVRKIDFNALKQNHWTEQESKNVAIISDFVQNLMNDHNFDYVAETFGSDNYTQHNLGMPDGINGLIDYIKAFVKRFPEYMYDVKHIVASGDMVVFHTHMVTKEKDLGNDRKGFIIMDRWRLENGEIREHWDSIQAINGFFRFYMWLAGGKIRNSNRLF